MPALADRVAAAISRYCMFRPGETVGVAVSGGADSVALLLLLKDLDYPVHIIHVDHQLRGAESDGDREFVRSLAASLGTPITIVTAAVALSDDNLEQAARLARLAAFSELLSQGVAHRVATGHTCDDQAETVLFRFLRGAHTAGLSGIRPVTAHGLVRPLLAIRRAELREFLAKRSQIWREDSTNYDVSLRRNAIRHRLLPELENEWNPQLTPVLAHHALLASEEEDHWAQTIEPLAASLFAPGPTAVICSVPAFRSYHPAVRRRLLRWAFARVKGDLRQIDGPHVEAALALFEGGEGHARLQIPGLDLIRSFEWMRIARLVPPIGEARFYTCPIGINGSVDIPEGKRISLEIRNVSLDEGSATADCQYNEGAAELDADLVRLPLVVRAWRPGDTLAVAGTPDAKKIKLLFQEARVPLWERPSWPVLEGNGVILWTRRFGVASGWEVTTATRQRLQVRETERRAGN